MKRNHRGFSLIELLVVIAIIGILISIILPVFFTVKENSREATTMSNLEQIQSALALYKLDNKKYPDVLFAYACDGTSGDGCSTADTMNSIAGDASASKELIGLYPEYVKDWRTFTCPNDTVTDPSQVVSVSVNQLGGDGGTTTQLGPVSRSFFKMDALDVSPQVTAVNQLSASTYVPRYQTSWTSYHAGTGTDTIPTDYTRQLRWINPPANTYITSVTDHVTNANRILVLYESGGVKKYNFATGCGTPYQACYDDSQTSIAATAPVSGSPGSDSTANFYHYDGTH